MIRRDKIIELRKKIFENSSLQVIQNVVLLIDVLIEEARQDNDTARWIRVARNQGKIEGLSALRDMITKAPPPKDSSKGINLT